MPDCESLHAGSFQDPSRQGLSYMKRQQRFTTIITMEWNLGRLVSKKEAGYSTAYDICQTCRRQPQGTQADGDLFSGALEEHGTLQITPSTGNMRHRSGRVVYARETLKLWNNKRMEPTSFRTDFLLNILPGQNGAGEGMAFVLTNNPSLPSNSSGQWLGICNDTTDGTKTDPVVAVEFDTRKSYEDDLDGNHIGIDINSIKSIRQYPLSNVSIILSSGSDVWVSIRYHGTSKLFQVFLVQHNIRGRYVYQGDIYMDLSQLLRDNIYLVFAGSTGNFTQLNQIKSWNFTMIDE